MKLQPIVDVTDMDAAIEWFQRLLQVAPDVTSPQWTTFPVAGGHLALHIVDETRPDGNVELSLVASQPLESLAERIEPARGIRDEPFGRSVVVTGPDGITIQVNEHH